MHDRKAVLLPLYTGVGFEAESSASGGGKVSEANDSETGRHRRRSETTGEKESIPPHHT